MELRKTTTAWGQRALSYPGSVLNLVDPQLHGHVEAVQDVPAEHQRVHRGVYRMDPTWEGRAEGAPMCKDTRCLAFQAPKLLGSLRDSAQSS